MMKDKGLGIFLKLLFGMGGIIILVTTWTEPIALPERIFATSFGFAGLSFALSQVISLIAGSFRTGGVNNRPEVDR